MESYVSLAALYDKLINDDIDYKRYADFIKTVCQREKVQNNSYLDLACGTGNLSVELAKDYKENFLIDLSEEMLSEAEGKLRSKQIKAKFVCQDIVQLNLNRKFDLITCCLDSVNYIIDLEDLKHFFRNVKLHLKEGGVFVFDLNSHYKISKVLGNNTFTFDSEEVFYSWQNFYDDEIVDMNLSFFVKEGESYKRFDECHTERAYKVEALTNLLNDTKLKIIGIYDDYDKILTEENEEVERITFVVKK